MRISRKDRGVLVSCSVHCAQQEHTHVPLCSGPQSHPDPTTKFLLWFFLAALVTGKEKMTNMHSSSGVGIGATLIGLGGLWYLLMETLAAVAFPGYSYSHNFISDLGVPDPGEFQGRAIDSPLANAMNAGFVGQALLVTLGAVMLFWAFPRGRARGGVLVLALIHSVGISLVGLVNGSQRNAEAGLVGFHFGGALLAIIAGNALIVLLGRKSLDVAASKFVRRISLGLGILGVASVIILLVTSFFTGTLFLFDYGTWERLSVYTILGGQVLFAVLTIAKERRASTITTSRGESLHAGP